MVRHSKRTSIKHRSHQHKTHDRSCLVSPERSPTADSEHNNKNQSRNRDFLPALHSTRTETISQPGPKPSLIPLLHSCFSSQPCPAEGLLSPVEPQMKRQGKWWQYPHEYGGSRDICRPAPPPPHGTAILRPNDFTRAQISLQCIPEYLLISHRLSRSCSQSLNLQKRRLCILLFFEEALQSAPTTLGVKHLEGQLKPVPQSNPPPPSC